QTRARPLTGAGSLPGYTSSPAERAEHVQLVLFPDARAQVRDRPAACEDAHVRADVPLLVDDPETKSRIAALEILQHGRDRRTPGLDLGASARVLVEDAADVDLHRSDAQRTERMRGRFSAIGAQRSPPSRLAQR